MTKMDKCEDGTKSKNMREKNVMLNSDLSLASTALSYQFLCVTHQLSSSVVSTTLHVSLVKKWAPVHFSIPKDLYSPI